MASQHQDAPTNRGKLTVQAPSQDRPCVEVTPGEARYLLALQDLERASSAITQADLARRLEVSRPTALQMVRRLRQLELIASDELKLTVAGTSAALVLIAPSRGPTPGSQRARHRPGAGGDRSRAPGIQRVAAAGATARRVARLTRGELKPS